MKEGSFMQRELLTRTSFRSSLSSLPALAGKRFEILTVTELSLKYLCFGHHDGRLHCAALKPRHCALTVGQPVYASPHLLRKEIEVKPKQTIEVQFEFPVRKVTVE